MKIVDRRFLDIPTKTCHASTVAMWKGKPIFAWFGGIREGRPDSSIYVEYDGELLFKISGDTAHWNPILFTVKDELFLSYKIGQFCDRWQTYILNITDLDAVSRLKKGEFTKEAQIIPAGLNFCVKTKPIIDGYGFIYCGSSVETQLDWASYVECYKYVDNKFIFVGRSAPLAIPKQEVKISRTSLYSDRITTTTSLSQGIIQPSLWKDDNDLLHAFFRSSRGLGKIYYAFEVEGDDIPMLDWHEPFATALDNPNSGIDTIYYRNELFLVHNPSSTNRKPLVLSRLGLDGFEDVKDEIVIREEVDDNDRTTSRELSYPYMVVHDGLFHLTYTYGRSGIEYVVIDPEN